MRHDDKDQSEQSQILQEGVVKMTSEKKVSSPALERTFQHPLQDTTYGENNNLRLESSGLLLPGTTASFSHPPNYGTASYLLSAARVSLLDNDVSSPGGTNDVSDEEGYANGDAGRNSSVPSSPACLKSLQVNTLPALPDLQDRKRFVGCLAAVVAAAYDYDEAEENDRTEDALRKETLAYLYANEDDEDDDEQQLYGRGSGISDSRVNNSTHSGEPSLPKMSSSGAPARSHSDDEACRHMRSVVNKSGISNETQSSRLRLIGFRRRKVDQAISRHRKRRYDVLCKLLISSAELLQLDKSQARAFLPVLSKLLVPPAKKKETDKGKPFFGRSLSNTESTTVPNVVTEDGEMPHLNVDPADPAAAQEVYSAAVHAFNQGGSHDFVQSQIDRLEHFRPFLEMLSPGSGIRCLNMLLLQHLLHSQEGYDARARHAMKVLGVLIFASDMEQNPADNLPDEYCDIDKKDLVALATRKFESLEHHLAVNLLQLQREQEKLHTINGRQKKKTSGKLLTRQLSGPTREQVMRGLKIGGTAVVAGTLFAVTGGLAAPGIAAGIGALAGGTAAASVAATVLSSTVAVTTIFGVGGGGLVGYKMGRRTRGLTEFEFIKESTRLEYSDVPQSEEDIELAEAELFSTICISGWLRDQSDFQRPWGATPTKPPIKDKIEILERFYSVHSPDHVPKVKRILQSWNGDEQRLWDLLKEKYGRDPDNLFPLDHGPRIQGSLTLEQVELVTDLFIELGYLPKRSSEAQSPTPFERMRLNWRRNFKKNQDNSSGEKKCRDSLHGPSPVLSNHPVSAITGNTMFDGDLESVNPEAENSNKEYVPPKHLSTVWDYRTNFGGELYTVRWESHLLRDLCDSVTELARDLVGSGAAQVLKHTALSTLMSAVAWPYALVAVANMIDGTWTLAVERADEAGKELARSLLFSGAGNRPVTLIGYSFGARTIYACLKELARYQELWEDYRETGKIPPGSDPRDAGLSGEKFYKFMREPASIVEDAIVCGLPNHLSLLSWKACRQVVAGRLVNCFSQKDLILSLMFQFKRLNLKPVCGTCPINVKGVENIDVTEIVSGHLEYAYLMGDILKKVRHGQPFQSRATMLFVPTVDAVGKPGNTTTKKQ